MQETGRFTFKLNQKNFFFITRNIHDKYEGLDDGYTN